MAISPSRWGRCWLAGRRCTVSTTWCKEPSTMLLVEVRRLDVAPSSEQFWTIVSRINGPEFMGVLYRAREAIFDSAGISFTIDLLSKFLQFDVTRSWSAADEGELFFGSAAVVGWLRVRHSRRSKEKLTFVGGRPRSEEHTSELQSRGHLVCRLLLEKKKT